MDKKISIYLYAHLFCLFVGLECGLIYGRAETVSEPTHTFPGQA